MKTLIREGVVRALAKGQALVDIPAQGACGSCTVKSLCQEASGRRISVDAGELKVGSKLSIRLSQAQGLWASFWAFGIPLALLFAGFFLGTSFWKTDLAGAFSALLGLGAGLGVLALLNPLWKKLYPVEITPAPKEDNACCGH